MGDLFDEFMRELERRRAQAEGRPPRTRGHDDDGGQGGPDDGDDGDHPDGDDHDHGHEHDDQQGPGYHGGPDDLDEEPAASDPIPLRRRRAAPGGPPRTPNRPRPVGGPNDGARPPSRRPRMRRLALWVAIVAIFLLILLAGTIIDLWTDAIWFQSVGFDAVFWKRIGVQVALFVGGLVVALVVLLGNLWLAGRLVPPYDPERPGRIRTLADRVTEAQRQAERRARMAGGAVVGPFGRAEDFGFGWDGDDLPDLGPAATWIIAGFGVLLAIGVAGAVTGAWTTLLLWLNRVPFSPTQTVTDPVFGRDISFFLFELPFLRFVQSLVSGLLLAALVVAGARYLVAVARGGEVFVTRVRVHLAILGGLYLLAIAFGYQLDKFALVYDQSSVGVAAGVGYTDANARFFAYDILTFLSGLAGALLIAGAFTRWMWPLGAIVVIWFSASIVLGRLYPEAVQRLSVDPNTYAQEEQYIGNNISMTRLAFGLDSWQSTPYAGTAPLQPSDITNEADTFTNARLWDYRPLQTTLDQLQTVRQYYDFYDVDTDRYDIDGSLRQVMLSARELAIDKNPRANNWVNQRIIYTHGIGLAMVPVNEVTPEGQPRLWIRDLPPTSNSGAPTVTEPRIYFGEQDDHYVVVGARQDEFDFPTGSSESGETTRWTGTTGIKVDSTLTRLLFALRFRDLDLLISDQIQAGSQLLFHRTIQERVGMIAPFLKLDKDPYLVVDGQGHLQYVQDAYTVSDEFPHATPFDPSDLGAGSGLAGDEFNYIRNSVKITMDAYDGTLHFYVNDPTDPLIRAWEGVFPTLFTDISQMPSDILAHLRTPEEQFNVQARVYGRYHVTDPLTFFNSTDLWTVPAAQTNQQSLPSQAYYVVMRMPGEPAAEFLLLQPMIPSNRPNMIAWVAARNDAPNRGDVRVFQFPADTTIFGPAQIEARIDQDPTISAQISLWNQSGSQVIRGNLIVVPVGDSLLYLQPVYLQSTSSAFPEFQKIVVASPTTIEWGSTLSEALTKLLSAQGGGQPPPSPSPGPSQSPGPSASPGTSPGASPTPVPSVSPAPSASPGSGLPTDVPGLIAYANDHFELAQDALRSGDFARYGTEIAKVQAALQRLDQLTASPGPSPQP